MSQIFGIITIEIGVGCALNSSSCTPLSICVIRRISIAQNKLYPITDTDLIRFRLPHNFLIVFLLITDAHRMIVPSLIFSIIMIPICVVGLFFGPSMMLCSHRLSIPPCRPCLQPCRTIVCNVKQPRAPLHPPVCLPSSPKYIYVQLPPKQTTIMPCSTLNSFEGRGDHKFDQTENEFPTDEDDQDNRPAPPSIHNYHYRPSYEREAQFYPNHITHKPTPRVVHREDYKETHVDGESSRYYGYISTPTTTIADHFEPFFPLKLSIYPVTSATSIKNQSSITDDTISISHRKDKNQTEEYQPENVVNISINVSREHDDATATIETDDPFASTESITGDLFRSVKFIRKKKIDSLASFDEDRSLSSNVDNDPKCKLNKLIQLIIQRAIIDNNPDHSKFIILANLAKITKQRFDILCTNGVVSFFLNFRQYCEIRRNNVSCLVILD